MEDVRAIVIISLTIIPFLIAINLAIVLICCFWDHLKTQLDDIKIQLISTIVLLIMMWAGGLCVMILKNHHSIIESIIIALWTSPSIIIFITLGWRLIKWLCFKKQASENKTS